MQAVQITFTRVFDVVRHESRMGTWTDFGFAWDQGRVFGARVQGHPPMRDGMTVRLVLQKAGQWSTILGWQDLQTGQVHLVDAGGLLGTALIAIAAYLLFTPLLLAQLVEGPLASSLAAGAGLMLPGALVVNLLLKRRQHAAAVQLLQAA